MVEQSEELAKRVIAAKRDPLTRERLIEDYLPFISATACEWSKKYINRDIDDEYSIAMMAFNEAIDRFDLQKGQSFIAFARMLIQRRLIDYYRKNHQNGTPLSDILKDRPVFLNETHYNLEEKIVYRSSIREEISVYKKLLDSYGLSLDELVRVTPRRKNTRQRAINAARILAKDKNLSEYLVKYKKLPIAELEKITDMNRKALERHRKYIMAIALLWIGQLENLIQYIKGE